MSVQELETAIRAKTNFVTLIFEDSGYGVIKWKQLKRYGRRAFVDFGNPNFAALAESFGCRGYKVTAAQELQPILEEAFRQAVPAVVACPVDYGAADGETRRLSVPLVQRSRHQKENRNFTTKGTKSTKSISKNIRTLRDLRGGNVFRQIVHP